MVDLLQSLMKTNPMEESCILLASKAVFVSSALVWCMVMTKNFVFILHG